MAKKNKSAPTGGSRVMSYVIVGALAVLVTYFLIVPAFTPKVPTTTTTGTSSGALTLTPSTDIVGTQVTVSGTLLPPNQAVAIKFDTAAVNLTGTCSTTATGTLSDCYFWVPSKPSGAYDVALTAGGTTTSTKFTIPQYSPPASTLLVTLTSLALGLVTQLVTRRVVDLDKERRMNAEVKAFQKEKREATLANDKQKLERLKKRELQMAQERAKVSTARFKVTGITFVPLLAVYYFMASFLGGYSVIVAYSPIYLWILTAPTQNPGVYVVSLFWWYFLSSFTFSALLSRLLHTTTTS